MVPKYPGENGVEIRLREQAGLLDQRLSAHAAGAVPIWRAWDPLSAELGLVPDHVPRYRRKITGLFTILYGTA